MSAFSRSLDRRSFLRLAALGGGALALSGCGSRSGPTAALVDPAGPEVTAAAARRAGTGQLRAFTLRAAPATIDLGGPVVPTWAYDNALPGKEIRVAKGDTVQVELANALPADTTIHWHGLALRNDMDGMPGITQPAIAAGTGFTYRFVADVPGTYWFHPHTGLQLDRGLYAPLIVEDPSDPGVDADWVLVLDDWLDGIAGATPDTVYAQLRSGSMSHGGMPGMDMGGMGGHGMSAPAPVVRRSDPSPTPSPASSATGSPSPSATPGMLMGARSDLLGGDVGDVSYPYYLINGRVPTAPVSFQARPGNKVRLRLINAGGDTAFRVALAGHRMTITHTDGHPVVPTDTDALLIGMGERYDVTVTLTDGVFPLVALAEGKNGLARALIRTGSGDAPEPGRRPAELDRQLVRAAALRPIDGERLAARRPDREYTVRLTGGMGGYDWAIDGTPFDKAAPLLVSQGQRVRLTFVNNTMMWHPMHLHGHTFALADGGPRKDTVAVLPHQQVVTEFDADNPGQWMIHCHNAYHLEAGMIRNLAYTR